MNFKKAVIAGLGQEIPEKIMTSTEIENRLSSLYHRLKLPFGRLELMTGIKERRYWPIGTRPSSLAVKAVEDLFQKTPFPKNKIDLLICASVCRDFLEPATASVVHAHLALPHSTMVFDLSNACLGVMNAIVLSAALIESEKIQTALIVSGENGGPLLFKTLDYLQNTKNLTKKDVKKFIASLTIGGAASAVLVTHQNLFPHAPKILGGVSMTESKNSTLCQGSGDLNSLMMETDSEALLKEGVALSIKTWEKTKKILGWREQDIDWVIGHQVGERHEKQMLKSLGLEKKKTWATYPLFGNTGSSALPLTLSQVMEGKRMGQTPQKGEKMALLGIGSGLTCLMLGMQI